MKKSTARVQRRKIRRDASPRDPRRSRRPKNRPYEPSLQKKDGPAPSKKQLPPACRIVYAGVLRILRGAKFKNIGNEFTDKQVLEEIEQNPHARNLPPKLRELRTTQVLQFLNHECGTIRYDHEKGTIRLLKSNRDGREVFRIDDVVDWPILYDDDQIDGMGRFKPVAKK